MVTYIFGHKGGQYCDYGSMSLHGAWTIQDTRTGIVDAPLALNFKRQQRLRCEHFYQDRWPIY